MSKTYTLSNEWRVDIARLDGLINTLSKLEAQLEVLELYREEFTQALAIRANAEIALLVEKTEHRIADKRLAFEQILAACEKIERERETKKAQLESSSPGSDSGLLAYARGVADGAQAMGQPSTGDVGCNQGEVVKKLQSVKANLHEAAARMTPVEFRAYLHELHLDEGAAADWLACTGTFESITERMQPFLVLAVNKGPSA